MRAGSIDDPAQAQVRLPSHLRRANGDLLRCGGAVFKFIEGGNIEALQKQATASGHLYPSLDFDGVTRRVPIE